MPLPGPTEAVALTQAAQRFDLWTRHAAGTSILHSLTPDKVSFQAGYLQALIDLESERFMQGFDKPSEK